jgi:hypothetical protein
VKPKKAPPARFAAKKPVEEEKKEDGGGDVDMKDEEEVVKPKPAPKAVEKKAPSAKTATTAASKPAASTKGPAGPNVKEEDLGQGLSKEEVEAKMQEIFNPELLAKCEEAKW